MLLVAKNLLCVYLDVKLKSNYKVVFFRYQIDRLKCLPSAEICAHFQAMGRLLGLHVPAIRRLMKNLDVFDFLTYLLSSKKLFVDSSRWILQSELSVSFFQSLDAYFLRNYDMNNPEDFTCLMNHILKGSTIKSLVGLSPLDLLGYRFSTASYDAVTLPPIRRQVLAEIVISVVFWEVATFHRKNPQASPEQWVSAFSSPVVRYYLIEVGKRLLAKKHLGSLEIFSGLQNVYTLVEIYLLLHSCQTDGFSMSVLLPLLPFRNPACEPPGFEPPFKYFIQEGYYNIAFFVRYSLLPKYSVMSFHELPQYRYTKAQWLVNSLFLTFPKEKAIPFQKHDPILLELFAYTRNLWPDFMTILKLSNVIDAISVKAVVDSPFLNKETGSQVVIGDPSFILTLSIALDPAYNILYKTQAIIFSFLESKITDYTILYWHISQMMASTLPPRIYGLVILDCLNFPNFQFPPMKMFPEYMKKIFPRALSCIRNVKSLFQGLSRQQAADLVCNNEDSMLIFILFLQLSIWIYDLDYFKIVWTTFSPVLKVPGKTIFVDYLFSELPLYYLTEPSHNPYALLKFLAGSLLTGTMRLTDLDLLYALMSLSFNLDRTHSKHLTFYLNVLYQLGGEAGDTQSQGRKKIRNTT